MSGLNTIDESDLISRAQSEGWRDLAIVPSEGDAKTALQRGWTSEHTFVLEPVPLALVSRLPSCPSLERLALPNANLGSSAEILGRLEGLTHLDIRSNYLSQSDLEATLSPLSNLEFLDISSNHIPSLQKIDFLSLRDSLRVLLVHNTGTDLASIRQLGSLEFLEDLDVSHNLVEPTFMNRLSTLGRLRRLNLTFCKIGDRLGALLGRLARLQSLNLQGVRIGEDTTRSLMALKELTELCLFNIPLTDASFSHISNLRFLTSLSISSDFVTKEGTNALKSLESLDHLTLHAEQVHDEGLQFLVKMPELTRLSLRLGTFGERMSRALGGLLKLKTLSVGSARIDYNVFSMLTGSLESLSVSAGHGIDSEWLSVLPRTSLRQLQLSSEARIGDQGVRAISVIQSLIGLSLPDNNITSAGARHISALTRLEHLNLNGNPIGDVGAEAVGEILSLVRLELRGCSVGPQGAKSLSKLVNLKSLILERNRISDVGLSSFRGFSRIEHLDLLGNEIGDVGAEVFSPDSFPRLSSLNLPNNNIGTRGARAISVLPSLKTLSLSGNPVGDDGLEALVSLRKLASLHLTGGRIGPRGAEALGRMSTLADLGLQNAPIGPDGARSLSRLSELQSLNINGCMVGDIGIQFILGMQRLKHLHASSNEITKISSPSRSVSIAGLYLANNHISDDSLRRMCREIHLENLEALDLSNNEISDRGLDEIHRLSTLQRLNLNQNKLSRLSVRLTSLEHLTYLGVANNPLEPTAREAIKQGIATLREHLREAGQSAARRSSYEVKSFCIAEGGQARVSEAFDLASNRKVAFKECLYPKDLDYAGRFQREIEASRVLHHPNIMPVLDSSPEEGWLTMPVALYTLEEYAGGRPLKDVDILEVVGALLAALDFAHGLEWVHRDIKPSNILYIPDGGGRWVLSDWGLVRRPRGQTTVPRRTKTGIYMGSEGFAPPELSGKADTAGPPCDLWSLGQLIGWMTTGEEPRQNIPLLALGPWRGLTEVLTRLEPNDRPKSVAEVRTLFEELASRSAASELAALTAE